jgi:hypothetical protein
MVIPNQLALRRQRSSDYLGNDNEVLTFLRIVLTKNTNVAEVSNIMPAPV